MFVCVCVCVCVSVHVCVCVYVCMCVHVCVRVNNQHTHVCLYCFVAVWEHFLFPSNFLMLDRLNNLGLKI